MNKTLSSKIVYQNPWMSVREDEFLSSKGKPGIYGVVETGDFSIIIPKIGDTFVLIKSFRYIIQSFSIEFPCGGLNKNEIPLEGAKRELAEETGLSSNNWRQYTDYYSANGITNDHGFVFLAENCHPAGDVHLDETEEIVEVLYFTEKEIKGMIKKGEIKDGPSISAFFIYLLNRE